MDDLNKSRADQKFTCPAISIALVENLVNNKD